MGDSAADSPHRELLLWVLQPVFNCLGLVSHLKGDFSAATSWNQRAWKSVAAGAKMGLAHDALIGVGSRVASEARLLAWLRCRRGRRAK